MNKIHSLRFITTYKCNFDCRFCHREGILNSTKDELDPDEFQIVLENLAARGLEKVKFVGGEPLMSINLESYIEIALDLNFKDVGITTNGVFTKRILKIADEYPRVKFAISIPTLDENEYRVITQSGKQENALRSLLELKSMGSRTTINMVIDRLSRIDEELPKTIERLFEFTNRVKLIAPCESSYSKPSDSQLSILNKLCNVLELNGARETGRYLNHIVFDYRTDSELLVTVPYCPIFCKDLQKLAPTFRLTPEGFVKPCLLHNDKNAQLLFGDLASIGDTIDNLLESMLNANSHSHSENNGLCRIYS